ncbi:MAG: exodeoxyribonuclease VII small subunit [Gammaproteobacteria bacterium TMED92]|nr:MAG: exodeoxyribonuclease VII small subunit [Gammaproteobacteria bacterium TMED92]
MTKNTESDEKLTFEAAMLELERLVEKMEAGDLTLEQSLQAFERGVVLTRLCQQELQQAELKVQQLNSDGELEAFDVTNIDDA